MKKKEEVEISKIFPIQEIRDNVIINGNGDITFSYELNLPEVYTLNHHDFNKIHEKLVAIIGRIKPGCCIHQQDFYSVDPYTYEPSETHSYTKRKNLEYIAFRNVLEHKSFIHLTYSVNDKVLLSFADNSYIRKRDFLFKNPLKNLDEKLNEADIVRERFEEAIKGIEFFGLRRLETDEILKLVSNTWNLDLKNESDKLDLSPISVYKNNLKVGARFVGIVSMTGEGAKIANYNEPVITSGTAFKEQIDINASVPLKSSFSFPIALGLATPHIVNTIIEPVDRDKMTSRLTTIKRSMNLFVGLGNDMAGEKKDNILMFQEAVNATNATMCLVRQNVITYASSEQELTSKLLNIETTYSNQAGYSAFIENYQSGNLFIASLPGNAKANFRSLVTLAGHAACYLPLETHVRRDKNGINFIDRFDRPIVMDLRETKLIVNKNKLVFGGSGSGKSYWLNAYLDQCVEMNYHVILMDKGGSFVNTVTQANGLYIDSNNQSQLEFNMFLCPQDTNGNYIFSSTDEDGEGGDDKINYIIVILQKIWKKEGMVDGDEDVQLRELITSYYQHVNKNNDFPDIDSFYEYISFYESNVIEERDKKFIDLRSLQNSLKPFKKDQQYGFLLNSQKRREIKDYRVIAFDLEGIQDKKMIYDIVGFIIVDLASNKIMNLPKSTPKMFLVDEAVDFLIGNTGKFVGDQARKIRKKGGELIIATQSVEFLDNVDPLISKSILRNADTKILVGLGKEQSALDSAKKFLSLTNHDIEIVKSLQTDPTKTYRESFIKLGHLPYVVRLDVSKEAHYMFSTSERDIDLMEKYKAKNDNDIELAIDQIIEDHG